MPTARLRAGPFRAAVLAALLAGFATGGAAQEATTAGDGPSPAAPAVGEIAIGTEAAALLAPLDLVPRDDAGDAPRAYGPAEKTFTIATWHLEARSAKDAAPRQREPVTVWRHTFGSERRTARWREIKAAGFDADIVALQGVRAAADARRLFEARSHHVVVSRQLLARSSARSTGIAVFRDAAPATTALAYRRQRGVRLAGFRHFLPDAPATGNGAEEAAAITAFRVNVYGQFIWLASLDLGPICGDDERSETCVGTTSILADFTAWTQDFDDPAVPLVLLGRWPGAVDAALETAGFRLRQIADDRRAACQPDASRVMLALPGDQATAAAGLEARAAPAGSAKCARLASLTMILRSPASSRPDVRTRNGATVPGRQP